MRFRPCAFGWAGWSCGTSVFVFVYPQLFYSDSFGPPQVAAQTSHVRPAQLAPNEYLAK
jgi:hypothetical protein